MNDQPLEMCLRQPPFSQPAQARQCLLSTNNASLETGSNIIFLSKSLPSGDSTKMQMNSKKKKKIVVVV